MHIDWLVIATILEATSAIIDALGINLGKSTLCDDTAYISCPCGHSDLRVRIKVKQCAWSHHSHVDYYDAIGSIRCKPCTGMTTKDLCPKYRLCEQCHHRGGKSCKTCPVGKFGSWCEITCKCQNGGSCERSGQCVCPEDFEGTNCEKRIGAMAENLETSSQRAIAVTKPSSQRRITVTLGCKADMAAVTPPMQVVLQPPDNPVTAVYSCPAGYVLSGPAISTCVSGKWSSSVPSCLDACPDIPVPIGGFVSYMSPQKSGSPEVSALFQSRNQGKRLTRFSTGLAVLRANSRLKTTDPDTVAAPLPAGMHRLGTTAVFQCESAYYKAIGSQMRRCQEKGKWSGRQSTCMPVCGQSSSPRSPFLLNGNATDIGQWPWQAGISRWFEAQKVFYMSCGGSLLNEIWVITAAHCVTTRGTTTVINPDDFRIYLGKYYRTDSKDDEYVQVQKAKEIHVHPDYNPVLLDSDIALIQMDSPVQLNSRVQPICLPTEQTTRNNLVEGKEGVVTGWGRNGSDVVAETLQQAVLPVVSHSACERGYELSGLPQTVTDNMFCAGYAHGRSDSCRGDSGGPMVFVDESAKERRWVLEGIVSWGSPRGCGNENQYGVYTTVSRYLDWINFYF